MNEWMVGWLVGWLDEWMDVRMNATRHVSVSKRKPQETGPRGRPNMLPIFNSWGSVAGVDGSIQSGTSDFITTPRLLSCSALAFNCLIYSSSSFLPTPHDKTQIRFGCRLMRNLYAGQTVGHFFCFGNSSSSSSLLSPPPPSLASPISRFPSGIRWPRQLALEEITIKLNGIQSWAYRKLGMRLWLLIPIPILFSSYHPFPPLYPFPILRPFVSTHTGGDCCFLTLSVHKFLWHFIDLICWAWKK